MMDDDDDGDDGDDDDDDPLFSKTCSRGLTLLWKILFGLPFRREIRFKLPKLPERCRWDTGNVGHRSGARPAELPNRAAASPATCNSERSSKKGAEHVLSLAPKFSPRGTPQKKKNIVAEEAGSSSRRMRPFRVLVSKKGRKPPQ